MQMIYFALAILLLLLNVAGLTAFASKWIRTYALARAAGLLLLVIVPFFIEHFYGFGGLNWLWPVTTLLSCWVLYQRRAVLLSGGFLRAETVFYLAFAYGLLWRFAFPSVHPSSEKVTDLYFITSYLSGVTLPPPDLWFPPGKFDFYYAMQHYGAALMSRIFGFSSGLTYNLGFCLLMALPITLAWEYASRFLAQRWKRFVIVAALAIGGTGVSPFMHIISSDPVGMDMPNVVNQYFWGSARFAGGYDQILNTDTGHKLFPRTTTDIEPREIPMENYGYQFALGDFHPPLGGFFLLIFAVALIGAIEKPKSDEAEDARENRLLYALLGLSVPAVIAVNTWVFPLQLALVGGWAVWRQYIDKRDPDWLAMIAGGVLGFALLYPFLTGIAAAAQATPIKLVQAGDHTPMLAFFMQHWPTILLAVLAMAQARTRKLGFCFALIFGGLLLISEFIYVDDVTGGRYERTNTTMKWWGWIYSGAVVALGVQVLASSMRWMRGVALATMILMSFYAYDMVRYYVYTGKGELGHLEATQVYARDPVVRDMYRYLKAAPDGIVLENIYGGAFTETGLYSLFAGKQVLLGWPMHILTWHAGVDHMWILQAQIEAFYRAEKEDAANWLLAHQVRYIVWNGKDAENREAWKKNNNTLTDDYDWHGFYEADDFKVGFWVRRDRHAE